MMMKRRKKRNVVCDTFKPFGNPGRKLRTNVITSAPPMAIADRAPGICSVFSVCIIVSVRALVLESLGRVYLFSNKGSERYSQNEKEEKIFQQSRDWICIERSLFTPE